MHPVAEHLGISGAVGSGTTRPPRTALWDLYSPGLPQAPSHFYHSPHQGPEWRRGDLHWGQAGHPFGKVLDAYCKLKGLDSNLVRLIGYGNRLYTQTPAMLKMEDGDIIDAIMEKCGD
jgi:hypothetical protein